MVKFSFNKRIVEGVVLLLFFGTLLYLGAAPLLQQRIVHEFPHGYYASDAFWQIVYTTQVYDTGNDALRPFYDSLGYQDVLGVLPPATYELGAGFAHLVGIAPYDALILLITLLFSFSALIMFLIIRRFNRNVALLSLPFMTMLFAAPNYTAITWGKHLVITGGFFLLTFFWSLLAMDMQPKKQGWTIIGIFLAAILMSHPPEFIFAVSFLIGMSVLYFLNGSFDRNQTKEWAYGLLLGFVLALPYAVIFYNTLWKGASTTIRWFKIIPDIGYPVLHLTDFSGWIGIVLAVGFGIAILQSIQHRKRKVYLLIIGISLFMLALGLSNYIGMQERSFQQRYFWPLYLAFFFGLGVWFAIKLFGKIVPLKKIRYPLIIILIIILTPIIIEKTHHSSTSPGLMDPYHWESFQFIKEKTAKDARILYVYGDVYNQKPILLAGQRRSYWIELRPLMEDIKNRIIPSTFETTEINNGDGQLAYRTGLFSFGYHLIEDNPKITANRSICTFDYVVFDKVSSNRGIIQYTELIRKAYTSYLQQKGKGQLKEVFQNAATIIYHNKHPTEGCFDDQKF
ncbi:MAG: hypothetical protein GXP63_03715 [DPANN group archaeon]|nr:hypothetical protein [DPANN group archaeon]